MRSSFGIFICQFDLEMYQITREQWTLGDFAD